LHPGEGVGRLGERHRKTERRALAAEL
jgi:hypothetical protein